MFHYFPLHSVHLTCIHTVRISRSNVTHRELFRYSSRFFNKKEIQMANFLFHKVHRRIVWHLSNAFDGVLDYNSTSGICFNRSNDWYSNDPSSMIFAQIKSEILFVLFACVDYSENIDWLREVSDILFRSLNSLWTSTGLYGLWRVFMDCDGSLCTFCNLNVSLESISYYFLFIQFFDVIILTLLSIMFDHTRYQLWFPGVKFKLLLLRVSIWRMPNGVLASQYIMSKRKVYINSCTNN